MKQFFIVALLALLMQSALPAAAQDAEPPNRHEWPVPVYSVNSSGIKIVLPETNEDRSTNFYEYSYGWNLAETGKRQVSESLKSAYPQIYEPYVLNDISSGSTGLTLKQTVKYYEEAYKRFNTTGGKATFSPQEVGNVNQDKYDYPSTPDFHDGQALVMVERKVEPKNKENTQHRYSYTMFKQTPDKQELTIVGQDSLLLGYPRSTDIHPLYDADNPRYGATAGYMVLHRRSAYAKKKRQNPDETLFELVYIDKTGKKVFDTTFNFGEKRHKLNQTIFYKSGNNIVMIAENWTTPESAGSVIFDLQGNEVSRTEFERIRDLIARIVRTYQRTSVGFLPYAEYSTPNVEDVRKDTKGNIYIFGEQRERERGLYIAKIKPDFTFDTMSWFNGWTNVTTTGRTRVIPLKVTDGEVVALAQMSTERGMTKLIKTSGDGNLKVSRPLGDGWGLFAKMQRITFK